MMQRYLLIFLLSGMGAGALKAEKVLDGFDEEPFEQPVILPEKTRLSPVAAYMESLPPAEREKPSVPCLLQVVEVAANRWPGLNGKAGTDWIADELFFQLNGCSITLGRQLFSGSLPAALLRDALLPGNTYENPEKADEICRAAFKNLKRVEGTLPAVPDTGAFRGMRVPGSGHLQRAVVAGELGL